MARISPASLMCFQTVFRAQVTPTALRTRARHRPDPALLDAPNSRSARGAYSRMHTLRVYEWTHPISYLYLCLLRVRVYAIRIVKRADTIRATSRIFAAA